MFEPFLPDGATDWAQPCIMSKATFPNTTRRRLSSSVVCRLSSSGAAFFFPRFFFHDPSLHSDKRPPKQGPYSCCSRPMIGLRGLWLGALRGPWPVLPMKTRPLDPSPKVRGLWPVLLVETGALWGLWPKLPPQTTRRAVLEAGLASPPGRGRSPREATGPSRGEIPGGRSAGRCHGKRWASDNI